MTLLRLALFKHSLFFLPVLVLAILLFAAAPVLAGPLQAPVIVSEGAPEVTPVGAVIEAKVNPEDEATTYHFEYATEAVLETLKGTIVTVGEGSFPGVLEELQAGPMGIGGLEAATTYYYRVVATNGTGTTKGKVEDFTTGVLAKPSIDEEKVTGVTQTDAELHALINPEYQETEYQFRIGTDTSYGLGSAPVTPVGLGGAGFFGDLEPVVNLNNEGIHLEPNTEYHYQALASNATGIAEGLVAQGDKTFLTLPNPPTVLTGEASGVGVNSATIAGSVNPGSSGVNSDTTYYFQYSTDTSYSTQIPSVAADAGQGTSAVPETAQLTGLEPDATYHYRIVASNDNTNSAGGMPQVVFGEGKTFTTPATPPVLGPPEAGAITQTGVTITTTIDARGLPAHYELRLADTQGSLEPQAAGNTTGSVAEPLAVNIASLTPGTVYYYKLIAQNPDGTVETPEASFTTVPAPAPQSVTLFPSTPLLSIPNVAFPTEEAGTITPIPRALTRAQKFAAALKACHKKKGAKRAVCERQARKKYGAVKARKKK